MQIVLSKCTVECPAGLNEITLGGWRDFYSVYGQQLDDQAQLLEDVADAVEKAWEIAEMDLHRLYAMAAHFTGVPLEEAQDKYSINDVNLLYDTCFADVFAVTDIPYDGPITWNGSTWLLPAPTVTAGDGQTFGEFIDSKMAAHTSESKYKWELLLDIACIFLRQDGEKYDPKSLLPDSDRKKLFTGLPLKIAFQVSDYYEKYNLHIAEFAVFQPSDGKSGNHIMLHMQNWGWVNFLLSIAKTKIFDVPGSNMNSIECVRVASAFDVLVYASESKEYQDAMRADMEANSKK